MTSNALSGDRRWASAKRSGMTVLGKVVVPKPINLPSQRSENHGLDPNVEIVPKGTLSWGSKPSSAWGSLSPNTDGSASSPSYLSGRPSSGSGTRPSTASSDRAHDLSTTGPNSRPASASGALTSNQTSLVSLRPRSAETRPGSSQLSRFAEHSDHPGAWNSAGTAEKLGVATSKHDGFSLTSGDFPTLGSGKESSGKNTDPQDPSSHGRPGSSSGGVGRVKETSGISGGGDVPANENLKNDTVNSWKRDNPPYSDDGGRPGMEKWQGNLQTIPVPPPHYDAWHGASINNPQAGGWFRGPPGGPPPYGNPVPPSGFPMEPFPYYRPQIPATGIPNAKQVPPPGAGPRGPHPKNGDMYRPHGPDAYIRPGIPMGPGFYPPPVAYEGYYNPRMGYCGSNERDVQYMGMAAGSSVYHPYPVQGAPEPGNPHGRSGGYGSNNQNPVGEQVESGQPPDNRGPYKVLLKHEDNRSEGAVSSKASGDQTRTSAWEKDWGSDQKDGDNDSRKVVLEEDRGSRVSPSIPVKVKPLGGEGNVKSIDDSSRKKLVSEAFGSSKNPEPLLPAPKDSSLIQKIEGLNAKARASDGCNETMSISNGEKQKKKFQASARSNQNTKESGGGSFYTERTTTGVLNPVSHEEPNYSGDKNPDLTAGANSRRTTHSMHPRVDNYGRGRINSQEVEGRQKKLLSSEPPAVASAVNLKASNVEVQDHHRPTESTDNLGSRPHGKPEGQPAPVFDRSDSQEQRAKMRELAKQRTRQLQEEEEERTKKQMAKARAKLEELNKRTQAVEGSSTQTVENASSDVVQNKDEEYQSLSESSMAGRRFGPAKSAAGSKPDIVFQSDESHNIRVEKPCLPSSERSLEAPKGACNEPPILPAPSTSLQQEVKGAKNAHHDNPPKVHESNVSKQKRTGFKQKQLVGTTEAPKLQADVEENVTASAGVVANEVLPSGGSAVPVNSNASGDTSLHPRKKHNKNGRSKNKIEDKSVLSTSNPSSASVSLGSSQPKASECQPDPNVVVQTQIVSRDADRSSDLHPSSPNEDSHGRVNSQWKPHQSRRMPRNPQNNRSGEKFHGNDTVVWTPVRPQNKAEVTDEASLKTVVDEVNLPAKSDYQVQNNSKNKRAEIERYVPKPVAKEMAQQGASTHQPVSSVVNQTATEETVTRAVTASQVSESSNNTGVVESIGISAEPRIGSNKHNKHGKAHGSWRQRGSTESTNTQGLQEGASYNTNVLQNVQKSNEQPKIPNETKERPKYPEEWSAGDDWGISDNPVEPVLAPTIKDHGSTARGKRHAFKGHKSTGNTRDLDQKRHYSGETDKSYTQSSVSETSQTDFSAASKENRGGVERQTSHWQPKSQTLPAKNQRGNRNNSIQNAGSEVAWVNKTDPHRRDWVSPPPTHEKDTTESSGQVHRDQPTSERRNVDEAPPARHQEPRRERKPAPPKGQSQPFLNQAPVNPVEQAPVDLDHRQEHRPASSGFRKNGNQNARFSQNQESRGDWNYSGQDYKQQNPPPNRERPRQNPRYEYQPVGPNPNKPNNPEGPREGPENPGARARGRGQNHSRRGGGNYYGRQGGVE